MTLVPKVLQLYFRAPKAGTGEIRFRTLIKRGVANEGTLQNSVWSIGT